MIQMDDDSDGSEESTELDINPCKKQRVQVPLASAGKQLESRLNQLSKEMGAQRTYTKRLEELLRRHKIPIPQDTQPNAELCHAVHYHEGLWPTKVEVDPTTKLTQHLVVAKNYSNFSASIVNGRSESVHPQVVDALVNEGPNFVFQLLCKPGNSDTFECIRVPATGAIVPLRKLVTFAANSKVDIETGAFRVDESMWTLKMKPRVSSGCPRLTPKLFKIRIEPILSESFCSTHTRSEVDAIRKQLTAESAPFRSVLRHHDSKALKAYRHKQQHFDSTRGTPSESEWSTSTVDTTVTTITKPAQATKPTKNSKTSKTTKTSKTSKTSKTKTIKKTHKTQQAACGTSHRAGRT